MTKEEEKEKIAKYTVTKVLLKLCEKTLADYQRCKDEMWHIEPTLNNFKRISLFYCFIRYLDCPYKILSVDEKTVSIEYYRPIFGKINGEKVFIKLPTFKYLEWIKDENFKRTWCA